MQQTTPRSRANLTRAIEEGPPHLRPLFLACRDYGCQLGVISQGDEPIRPPLNRATMLLVGDDTDVALGPDGFRRDELTRFIAGCEAAVIVSSAAHLAPYAAAASNAVLLRQNVIVVETRLEQEQTWIEFVRAARPDIHMLVSTVRPAGRA